jgi:hypothetical protein
MIAVLMHTFNLFIWKFDDVLRLPSRIERIRSICIEDSDNGLVELTIGVLVSSFHLVENDSFELFLTTFDAVLVAPTLLSEIEFIEERFQTHIQIYFVYVFKVFGVWRRKWICCVILTCPCIHEGVHWSSAHRKKRIANWISLSSTTG